MKTLIHRIKLALLATIALLLGAFPAFSAQPPNIVLVMADDQGWGDMGYTGHPYVKTPHFDALAKEGLRFDNFYAAAPVCSPTRGSVLTGRHPNRFGCFSWGNTLRPQEITIAQALKKAGYRTGHFGKWHIGSVHPGSPVNPGAAGFDTWISAPNFFDLDPILSVEGKATPFQGESSEITVELALEFIRESVAKKERFLAVVWFGSPHVPHEALEKDRQLYKDRPAAEQNFLAEITAMDRAFGRLRNELRELGIRDNTLLWYCSDNGALPKVGSSGGRRGHKGDVYEGGLLVPALIEWPAKVKSPRAVTLPAVTSDIYPTVLELAGIELKNQPILDGVSLVPLLEGKMSKRAQPIGFWSYPARGIRTPAEQWMRDLYAAQQEGRDIDDPARLFSDAGQIREKLSLTRFPGHAAWLDGDWKLHRIEGNEKSGLTWELYNLADDPKESRNLTDTQPARTAVMRKDLETWLQSVARSQNGGDYPKTGR